MNRLGNKQFGKKRAWITAICLLAGGFFCVSTGFDSLTASAQKKSKSRSSKIVQKTQPAKPTAFPHNKHRLKCDSCHKFPSANWKTVRKIDAFPDVTDYPHHESCLNCHRQQFFKGAKPAVCSICHLSAQPQGGPRHPFPNPREIFDQSPKGKRAEPSDFQIFFPHEKHIDIVSRNERVGETMFVKARFKPADESSQSCAVCHQTYKPQGDGDDEYLTKPPEKLGDAFWLKKGTFKTTPTAHTTCFTCHSTDTGILPAPSDCATCHKLSGADAKTDFDAKIAAPMKIDDKITLMTWRKRDSSATFRHEFFSHADLACATCHNVRGMNTTDALTKKVKVLSCGGDGTGCHITPTLDDGGILNYEMDERRKNDKFTCVKCHLAFGRQAVPASHTQAVVGGR